MLVSGVCVCVGGGMADFKKWGDPSNEEGDDFGMGGLIPLYGL